MIGRDPVITKSLRWLSETVFISRNHPPLAGGEVFDRVKRKSVQVRQRSDGTALVKAADGVTGIVNQRQSMAVNDGTQAIIVARLTSIIDSDDRFCSGRDFLFGFGRIRQQRLCFDISEDRSPSLIDHTISTGSKRHRRHYYFITWLDTDRDHRPLKAPPPVTHGH